MDYVVPIAHPEALVWIVKEQRTALPKLRERPANAVEPGDRVFLYTTRGCFHNPYRDRGRIAGEAVVTHRAKRLGSPMIFGGREYAIELRFRIKRLAPMREGVELAPLIGELVTFPDVAWWGGLLRRALVPLAASDGDLLAQRLPGIAPEYPLALSTYLA